MSNYTAAPATTRAAIQALNDATTISLRGGDKIMRLAQSVLDDTRERWEQAAESGDDAATIHSSLDDNGAAHEIADGAVPIYDHELHDLLAESSDLGAKPELGPAYDGEPTVRNIIAANVYELCYHIASAELENIRDEQQELEEEAEED